MNMSLRPEVQRFVEERLRSGQYATAEDVVEAGLTALKQQEAAGEFVAGEWDKLLEQGERSIEREGTIDAGEVFAELRRRNDQRRGSSHVAEGR